LVIPDGIGVMGRISLSLSVENCWTNRPSTRFDAPLNIPPELPLAGYSLSLQQYNASKAVEFDRHKMV
jgi:hypothetical protein